MRGVLTEKNNGTNCILFEDGQVIHFDEKSFPRGVKEGDIITVKFSVNKSLSQKVQKIIKEYA